MITRRATFDDIYLFCKAEQAVRPNFPHAEVCIQFFASIDCFAVLREGAETPLAVWGVAVEAGASSQAWFSCSAELEAMPQTGAAVILAIARAFPDVAAAHERGVVCRVALGDARGERIAGILNFSATQVIVAGAQVWRHQWEKY